ncbi:hypothetical protein HPB51_008630 [Rhipicephalus microplus]|uniref:Uncharacterized protein n=1 Tax=Rhipicephalus microplus TaxID=6941 RepID=A0A9J6EMQ1_RHIMP|nr:hypothetical protein HPB51_008630 [Rhipicephalus microplus]
MPHDVMSNVEADGLSASVQRLGPPCGMDTQGFGLDINFHYSAKHRLGGVLGVCSSPSPQCPFRFDSFKVADEERRKSRFTGAAAGAEQGRIIERQP